MEKEIQEAQLNNQVEANEHLEAIHGLNSTMVDVLDKINDKINDNRELVLRFHKETEIKSLLENIKDTLEETKNKKINIKLNII